MFGFFVLSLFPGFVFLVTFLFFGLTKRPFEEYFVRGLGLFVAETIPFFSCVFLRLRFLWFFVLTLLRHRSLFLGVFVAQFPSAEQL